MNLDDLMTQRPPSFKRTGFCITGGENTIVSIPFNQMVARAVDKTLDDAQEIVSLVTTANFEAITNNIYFTNITVANGFPVTNTPAAKAHAANQAKSKVDETYAIAKADAVLYGMHAVDKKHVSLFSVADQEAIRSAQMMLGESIDATAFDEEDKECMDGVPYLYNIYHGTDASTDHGTDDMMATANTLEQKVISKNRYPFETNCKVAAVFHQEVKRLLISLVSQKLHQELAHGEEDKSKAIIPLIRHGSYSNFPSVLEISTTRLTEVLKKITRDEVNKQLFWLKQGNVTREQLEAAELTAEFIASNKSKAPDIGDFYSIYFSMYPLTVFNVIDALHNMGFLGTRNSNTLANFIDASISGSRFSRSKIEAAAMDAVSKTLANPLFKFAVPNAMHDDAVDLYLVVLTVLGNSLFCRCLFPHIFLTKQMISMLIKWFKKNTVLGGNKSLNNAADTNTSASARNKIGKDINSALIGLRDAIKTKKWSFELVPISSVHNVDQLILAYETQIIITKEDVLDDSYNPYNLLNVDYYYKRIITPPFRPITLEEYDLYIKQRQSEILTLLAAFKEFYDTENMEALQTQIQPTIALLAATVPYFNPAEASLVQIGTEQLKTWMDIFADEYDPASLNIASLRPLAMALSGAAWNTHSPLHGDYIDTHLQRLFYMGNYYSVWQRKIQELISMYDHVRDVGLQRVDEKALNRFTVSRQMLAENLAVTITINTHTDLSSTAKLQYRWSFVPDVMYLKGSDVYEEAARGIKQGSAFNITEHAIDVNRNGNVYLRIPIVKYGIQGVYYCWVGNNKIGWKTSPGVTISSEWS